jgi:hypothetical protein
VPGKETPVLTKYVAGWAPRLLLDAMVKSILSFIFAVNGTSIRLNFSRYATQKKEFQKESLLSEEYRL